MVLSQWCLFVNSKVDFTIHSNLTTDDPEQVSVINGNKSGDNPEPRHKIQMIQRTEDLPRDPDDQLMPDVERFSMDWAANDPNIPASGPDNYNIHFTIHPNVTILLLLTLYVWSWRRNGSVWMASHQPAQSIHIVMGSLVAAITIIFHLPSS